MKHDIDRDLYEILGVDRSAGPDEIKNAYRAKAMECHPDVADHEDAEYHFKELTFAYEILSDPDKRRDYDMFGLDSLRRGAGQDSQGFMDFSDIMDMFFGGAFGGVSGGGFRRRRARVETRGRDMETVLPVTLEDVFSGASKTIDLTRMATCEE